MAYHAVALAQATMAKDVDSLNRNIVGSADLDNGFVVRLDSKSSTAGEAEVWTATIPTTSNLGNVWMVMNPEVVLTDSKYLGIDPNVRNFYLATGKIGTAFKLQLGDLVKITAEGLTGTQSTNTFVEAVNNSYKLSWAASATSGSTALKLRETSYFSIPDGGINTQRVTAFVFEVVQVA